MIITQELKNIYKNMINELISPNGLTNKCILSFNNGTSDYCDNCLFDPISKVSANIYNGTGPRSFINYTVCPECLGLGVKQNNNKTKTVNLAVIFDSKSFINFDPKVGVPLSSVVNIPNINIQTICHKNLALDIRNCSSMSINNTSYERVGDVNPVGLGDLDFIFTNWKRL
jgi:hypothetical protein